MWTPYVPTYLDFAEMLVTLHDGTRASRAYLLTHAADFRRAGQRAAARHILHGLSTQTGA